MKDLRFLYGVATRIQPRQGKTADGLSLCTRNMIFIDDVRQEGSEGSPLVRVSLSG